MYEYMHFLCIYIHICMYSLPIFTFTYVCLSDFIAQPSCKLMMCLWRSFGSPLSLDNNKKARQRQGVVIAYVCR